MALPSGGGGSGGGYFSRPATGAGALGGALGVVRPPTAMKDGSEVPAGATLGGARRSGSSEILDVVGPARHCSKFPLIRLQPS
jgi:hypothetical protein